MRGERLDQLALPSLLGHVLEHHLHPAIVPDVGKHGGARSEQGGVPVERDLDRRHGARIGGRRRPGWHRPVATELGMARAGEEPAQDLARRFGAHHVDQAERSLLGCECADTGSAKASGMPNARTAVALASTTLPVPSTTRMGEVFESKRSR